jgi:hypothetical protein
VQQPASLSSDFEHLVTEYNNLLRQSDTSLRERGDAGQEEQVATRSREKEQAFHSQLEALPAATYTTDAAGRITFYNEAAVEFAGRRANLGSDQWCVTWRLYSPDGKPLPHDECPMAVALREGRAIRGAKATAERPDGTRISFVAYPTPLLDGSGALVGAVNMLLDIGEPEQTSLDDLRVLIVAADGFVAAELDLVIDNEGAETAAIAPSISDALMLLDETRVDAAVVSLPNDEAGPLIDAFVRRKVPFVIYRGDEQQVAGMLKDALRVRNGAKTAPSRIFPPK